MPIGLKLFNPHPKTSNNTAKLMEYAPPALTTDDPEFMREVMRPAEIKEDLSLMENRKRVSLILNSESFRRDLEEVVKLQLQSGPYPDSWAALQSLSDLLVPRAQYGAAASTFTKGSFMPAMPINDLRAAARTGDSGTPQPPRYGKAERMLRCKLASVFRLVDIFGWGAGMTSCITARLSRESDTFLMNPFGLLYHEITASSLVKINLKGEVIDVGTTGLQVDSAAWIVPAAIHAARKDIRCIIQLRNPATVAVSAMKCGLLPLSQEAMICGPVAIYDPFTTDKEEEDGGIAKALGERAKVLLVRSHGLYACGSTVEEAWHFAFNAIAACQSQLKLLPLGLEKLVIPGDAVRDSVFQVASGHGAGGVEMHARESGFEVTLEKQDGGAEESGRGVGELEFEALMRQLDQAGYRTGYLYRPLSGEMERPPESADELSASDDEVLVPPAASSYVKSSDDKSATVTGAGAAFWSNTPNAYKREEIEEIGTTNPKKITRWREAATEEKQTSGLAQAIVSPNQFAPQGADPQELKGRQKEIKEHYFQDKVDPGHQSKLLENITYEEARKMQEAREGKLAGDHVVIVGAVSKGIIQRDHRHNVAVYQSVYATNPFHQMTDADLLEYQREVRRKNASPEELAIMDAEDREAAERAAAAVAAATASYSETEEALTPTSSAQTRTLPPMSSSARDSGAAEQSSPTTTSKVASVEIDVSEPVRAVKASATLAAPPSVSIKRNESERKGAVDRAGPSSGYTTMATPGRTDTSEADFTTHTEVTDTEAEKDKKEKKKKRKLFSFSLKKDKHHKK